MNSSVMKRGGQMEYKILIAEDDKDIVELLALYLENDAFTIFKAYDGLDALQLLEIEHIDLLIIDIMMPHMDGYETIKKIREFSHLPIIVLSAKSMDQDKILGLGMGADMYMTKPFNPLEVIANVKALLRRTYDFQPQPDEQIKTMTRLGELEYDNDRMVLKKNGQVVALTACELKILIKMMKSPGRVFTKGQLYEAIGNDYYIRDDDTMMVHISKIRAKIEDNPSSPRYIKTVRGLGYKFDYEED